MRNGAREGGGADAQASARGNDRAGQSCQSSRGPGAGTPAARRGPSEMHPSRRELALTAVMLVGLGATLVDRLCWLAFNPWVVLVPIALGALIAWLARRAGRPAVALGVAAGACLAGTLERTWHRLETAGSPGPWDPFEALASACIVAGPVLVGLAAAVAACCHPRGLVIAAGLVASFPLGGWPDLLGLAAALLAAAVIFTDVRRETVASRIRDGAALIALSVLASRCVLGLSEDLAATIAPLDLEDTMRWWAPDPPHERAARVFCELATLAAIVGLVRGRTWGALALGPAAGSLALCAWAFWGPAWGDGSYGYPHVLRGGWGVVSLCAAVALAPWLAPFARALRAPRARAGA